MMRLTTGTASVLKYLTGCACALLLAACGGTSGSAAPATSAPQPESGGTADSIAMASPTYTVGQAAGSITLTVTRAGSGTTAASVDFATTDGTAVAGTDYTASSGTLNWAEGDLDSKTIVVLVSNETPFSGARSFSVAITSPSDGITIGSPGTSAVTITGDATESAGNAQFSSATYQGSQSAGTVNVTVNRTDGASGAVSVAFATGDGTAKAGTDYTATSGVLEWSDGDASSKTIPVSISAAKSFTGSRQFQIALSDARSGLVLGSPSIATVTINGSNPPSVGSLQLSSSTYNVGQNDGSVKIIVNRSGGTSGAASVNYTTKTGTAVASTDYTGTNGTLNWPDGDATPKSVSVTISNTAPFSGNKAFSFILSAPSTGASISNPGSATVTIAGDATAPVGSLKLSSSSYSVSQSAGSVKVTVNRSGGSSGAVSVGYSTSDSTAVAGRDYTARSGTLNWADGDSSDKSFSVTISNAAPFSGNRSFKIGLANPGGGSSVTSPATATVTIAGSASAAIGSVQLSASSYSVAQSAGTLKVTVNRTGGSSGAIGVSYATSNGSAVSGTDYTSTQGTLSWADGDASAKTFSIPISNSSAFSGTRSLSVALSSATGGASMGSPASAGITISGSGSSGSSYWVYYNGVFNWGGDLSYGGLSVNYQSTGGSPMEGPYDISCTGNNGGFQPRANNNDFDTTSYKYLVVWLKPTIPNQQWVSGFEQVGDVEVGVKINVTDYGASPPVIGQWNQYKIPLGAGGYQIPAGTHIYKFMLQDQTANMSGYNGPTNVWYVDNIEFTAN